MFQLFWGWQTKFWVTIVKNIVLRSAENTVSGKRIMEKIYQLCMEYNIYNL